MIGPRITHLVTLTGRVPRLVRCESCAYEYVYIYEVKASGQGSGSLLLDDGGAETRANESAHFILHSEMEHGCAVVPCAQCGRVQEHMIPTARATHRWWMFSAGVSALLLSPLAAMGTCALQKPIDGDGLPLHIMLLWTCVAILLVAGLVLPNLRLFLAERYDPNTLPVDLRKAQGTELSVSKDDYVKMMQRPS